jgi:hypothetical protein
MQLYIRNSGYIQNTKIAQISFKIAHFSFLAVQLNNFMLNYIKYSYILYKWTKEVEKYTMN